MNVLVDTNITLRVVESDAPEHPLCVKAVERLENAGEALCGCAQTAIEFWVVATRPRNVRGLGLSPAEAEAALRSTEDYLLWLPEPPDIAARWRQLVNQYAVLGKAAHDARLVAFMEAHGLTHLLTLNTADFARYTSITALHPNDVK
jgi:predicted nucleic acid-binding protein